MQGKARPKANSEEVQRHRRSPDPWLLGAVVVQAALSLLVIWTHLHLQAGRLAAGWWFLTTGRVSVSVADPVPVQALMALPIWLFDDEFEVPPLLVVDGCLD